MKHFIILGCGKSGKSVAEFLLSKGFKVILFDDNKENADALYNSITQNRDNLQILKNEKDITKEDIFLLSPGISKTDNPHKLVNLAKTLGCTILSSLDLFKQYFPSFVIGVTGTNGKSTVTTILYHQMRALCVDISMGGNIGISLLDIGNKNTKHIVIELSSYELENSINPACNVIVITNIYPWHLERHKSMGNYVKAKLSAVANNTTVILNADDKNTEELILPQLLQKNCNIMYFSTKKIVEKGVSIVNNTLYLNGKTFSTINLPYHLDTLQDNANIAAALCAIVATFATSSAINANNNADLTLAIESLASFRKPPHRCEIVNLPEGKKVADKIDNIKWVNDSKATNFLSLQSCLNTFANNTNSSNCMLICGGKIGNGTAILKGYIFSNDIRDLLLKHINKIEKILLIGEAATHAQEILALEQVNKETPIKNKLIISKTLQQAVQEAFDIANSTKQNNPQYNILFAPGHQSFDQFKNFEHRGEMFKQYVYQLYSKNL